MQANTALIDGGYPVPFSLLGNRLRFSLIDLDKPRASPETGLDIGNLPKTVAAANKWN